MTKQTLSSLIVLVLLIFSVNLVHAKKYRVACLHDYYPYTSMNDQGEASGILIDWWELWSKKSGIDVEFVPVDLQNVGSMLESGEVDILAGVYFTDERADKLDFSDPILRLRSVVYLRNELEVSDSLKATITLLSNSIAEDKIKAEYPQLKINGVSSYSLIREEAKLYEYDGFVYDVPSTFGKYTGIKAPKGYYEYATLFSSRLRPAVLKGNKQVLKDIMSGLNKITAQELIVIAEKYNIYKEDKNWKWIGLITTFCLTVVLIVLLVYMGKQKKKNQRLVEFESNTDWQVILDKGENDLIEFKSSMRWDYRQEKPNKALEMVIVKTISAFLNTEGGMLFIGVDDDGNTLGLEPDYNSYSKKSRDGFLLGLTNLINQHLGKRIHQFLNINIISINEKDVCIVNIDKGDKPVFIGKSDKEEFYIRTSASSQPLSMREAYEYIQSHW
ncbi:transporter substrate-binding domain-containing protein [Labilibacter sediminis]|nr:transporter substrate-binding domain-containing protein [Labilibacter sediminis]